MASETVASYQGASFLAGVLAALTQASEIFEKSPMFGFITMGLLGAFAGFGLLMEQGKYDEVTPRRQIRSLLLRLGIGFVVGVGVGLLWGEGEGQKGYWMIATVIIAAAPIDMLKVGVEVLSGIIKRRGEK